MSRYQVLHVEDSPDDAELVSRALARAGAGVWGAPPGRSRRRWTGPRRGA